MDARTNKRKTLQAYARIISLSQIALAILLLYALSIPIIGGGSITSIMQQSGYQLTRVTVIASSVKTLTSRPSDEHAQAVSNLQNALLAWEHTQDGLTNGSAALHLPSHVPDDIAQQLSMAQSDFIAIDTAARIILKNTLASPDILPDPVEVQIVLDHEQNYRITMNQVVVLWQQRIDNALAVLIWIEDGFTVALIGSVIVKYLFITRGMFKIIENTPN